VPNSRSAQSHSAWRGLRCRLGPRGGAARRRRGSPAHGDGGGGRVGSPAATSDGASATTGEGGRGDGVDGDEVARSDSGGRKPGERREAAVGAVLSGRRRAERGGGAATRGVVGASGRGARRCRATLSGRRCRAVLTAALSRGSARRVAATRQRRLTSGARLSAISDLLKYPKEISSKQLAGDLEKFWKNSWR
jgi:hypothetical protein